MNSECSLFSSLPGTRPREGFDGVGCDGERATSWGPKCTACRRCVMTCKYVETNTELANHADAGQPCHPELHPSELARYSRYLWEGEDGFHAWDVQT